MIRYRTLTISSGSTRVTADALAGLGERDRTIRAVIYAPALASDGVSNANNNLVVFKNQDQVCEFAVAAFVTIDTTNDHELRSIPTRIPLDIDLRQGQGLEIGIEGASISADRFILEYEDK